MANKKSRSAFRVRGDMRIYLKNMTASRYVEVVACADILPERAQVAAQKYWCGQGVQREGIAG